MKTYLQNILILSLLFSTGNIAAATWDNGGVITTINSVTVVQNGGFYIAAKDDICDQGVNRKAYVYKGQEPGGVKQSPEAISMMLSVALTAQATQSKVKLFADDSGSLWGCRMGAIQILH